MSYVTVESTVYCVTSRREGRFRLTYEVKPLREGLDRWFLVAMEEIQPAPPATLM